MDTILLYDNQLNEIEYPIIEGLMCWRCKVGNIAYEISDLIHVGPRPPHRLFCVEDDCDWEFIFP